MKEHCKHRTDTRQEPPYFIGTKRPSLEHDYYEMVSLDTVEITNSPISEVTETGIRTKDGKSREFDVIAVCTGYDAVTGGLRTMGIKGRDGIDLDQKWKDGVVTHLGMSVHNFPNFFMVYGPQGLSVPQWGRVQIANGDSTDVLHQWSALYRNPMRVDCECAFETAPRRNPSSVCHEGCRGSVEAAYSGHC